MHVLHVVHGYAPETYGGVERYLADLAPAQQADSMRVTVLAGSMQPWAECGSEQADVDGVSVIRMHRDDFFYDHHAKIWHPGISAAFSALVRSLRPDLIHVHHWLRLTSDLVERGEAAGIPVVVTLHDAYTTCPRAFRVDRGGAPCRRRLGVSACLPCVPRYGHETEVELATGIELFAAQLHSELRRARRLLVADPATAELVALHQDLPAERFAHLPLAYSPRFAGPPPPPAGAPSGDAPLRFAYFGILGRHKGVAELLEAFATVSRTSPMPVELHLFGNDESPRFGAELRQAARGLPVVFHGPYTPEVLATAGLHVAVLPSLAFETFGLVLDEAFELGLPCIVADHGALPRRAAGGGLRVPAGDVAALARAMLDVRREPALIDRLRAAIPPPPPPRATHAARLRAVYEAALAAPPQPHPAAVAPARRAAFAELQRQTAAGADLPSTGPE